MMLGEEEGMRRMKHCSLTQEREQSESRRCRFLKYAKSKDAHRCTRNHQRKKNKKKNVTILKIKLDQSVSFKDLKEEEQQSKLT